MQDLAKRVMIGSMAVAGIVALAAISDLVIGFPFSGQHTMLMDILFLVSAAIIIYLGWSTYQDLQ